MNLHEKFLRIWKKNRSLIAFVVLTVVVRVSLADHYVVPTGSMLPTIEIGRHILVNKAVYDLKLPFTQLSLLHRSDPQPGDVIVFASPEPQGPTLVKRLIAVPGDYVEIDNGFVKINGEWIEGSEQARLQFLRELEIGNPQKSFSYVERFNGHEYVVQRDPHSMRFEQMNFVVPAEQFFFMGDNRDHSADSRFWGFVSRELLKGRAYYAVGLTELTSLDRLSGNEFGDR